jgi:nucleotide-binding universal stress UspA family protein
MARYQNILVAVDGSAQSLHALQSALRLPDAQITAVSVAPPYEGDLRLVGVNLIKNLLREPCHKALSEAQALAEKAGKAIKTACLVGLPHEEIVKLAESENRDLIVMGVKGQGLLKRILLGSVTRRVIGFTKRDVMVVPPQAGLGWEKLLLATDGSENSQPAGNRALELALAYGAELRVLSIPEAPGGTAKTAGEMLTKLRELREVMLEEIRAQAEALGIKIQCVIGQGPPAKTIVDYARKESVNLIVLGSHGRTGLTRLLMGSVTERVIGLAPCPVLVVKV